MMPDNDTIDMAQLGSLSQDYGGKRGKPAADRRRAADMAPGEMTMLRFLMSRFLGEEAKEPEHQGNDAKLTKAEVAFEHPAKGPHHCIQCRHFLGTTCEIVQGAIDPGDWCKKFVAKTAQDAQPMRAAGVVVRAPAGDCLFMKRSTAGDHAGEWAFPGGKVEYDETPLRAARRELAEETGYHAPRLHALPIDDKIRLAADDNVSFSTFLHHAKDCFKPALDAEHTEFMWAKPDKAPQPLHPGVKALLSSDRVKDVLAMDPLTAKGREIMDNMKRKYGNEKGERVFYASKNKGTISGVEDEMPGLATASSSGVPMGKWKNAKDATNTENEPRDNTGKWTSGSNSLLEHTEHNHPGYSESDIEGMIPDDDEGGASYRVQSAYDSLMAHDAVLLAMDEKFQRQKDVDGRLHVGMTPLTKANVCPYVGKEIPRWKELGLDPKKTYKLYRDPVELQKGLKTFNGLPVLVEHEAVDAKNPRPDLVVGSTGTDAQFKDPYLTNGMVIWADDAIDDIENDKQRELSASYHYDADMRPGIAPDGTAYDGVMRNIKGNHIALVKEGRAGHDVLVADSADTFKWGRIESALEDRRAHVGAWK